MLSRVVVIVLCACCPVSARSPENVFRAIMGPVPTDVLRVAPCDGGAPMLCVDVDTGARLVVELLVYPRSRQSELQSIQEELRSDGARAEVVLERFASQHLQLVENDRRGAYGGEMRFVPLPGEPAKVGALDGWLYGYTVLDPNGRPIERHVAYAAFDDDVLYVLGVPFDDDPLPDADVERLMPELSAVVAGLRLPAPVEDTDVGAVDVIEDAAVATLVYGEGVLGPVPAATRLDVTGRSPDGRFWRVRCPDDGVRECWLPSDTTRAR